MAEPLCVAKKNAARTYQMRVAEFLVARSDEGRGSSREEIAQALNIAVASVDVALRELHKRVGRVMHPSGRFEVDVCAVTHMDHFERGHWFAPKLGRFLIPEIDGRVHNKVSRGEHVVCLANE